MLLALCTFTIRRFAEPFSNETDGPRTNRSHTPCGTDYAALVTLQTRLAPGSEYHLLSRAETMAKADQLSTSFLFLTVAAYLEGTPSGSLSTTLIEEMNQMKVDFRQLEIAVGRTTDR